MHYSFRTLAQLIKILLVGSVVILCVFSINQFNLPKYFPIKTVRVYGVNHIGQNEVELVLEPLVRRGFFGINIDYIRERLMQQPWVADISVRRNWPDKVEVTVVERKAVAHWDKQTLLSDSGELFAPKQTTVPGDLPVFEGPEGKQVLMLNYFNQINRLLVPLHAKISYLELTPYLTWKVKLDNGMTMQMGHKDILTRLDHFVKVYPKIVADKAADVDLIDLRYPNGVAIRWKINNYGKEAS